MIFAHRRGMPPRLTMLSKTSSMSLVDGCVLGRERAAAGSGTIVRERVDDDE
jgi:hypothetical protein